MFLKGGEYHVEHYCCGSGACHVSWVCYLMYPDKRYHIRVRVTLMPDNRTAWAIMGRWHSLVDAEQDLLMHKSIGRECFIDDTYGSDYIPYQIKQGLSKWVTT